MPQTTPTLTPTGVHHRLSGPTDHGHVTITVADVAAALRSFEVDGIDIVQRCPVDSPPSLGAGIVMSPWPNRIDAGRWLDQGTPQQLSISEPELGNALHGLLTTTQYRLVHETDTEITLAATIFASPGYPFVIETTVTYAITPDGLEVTHTAVNRSDRPAPYALGTHAYFKVEGTPTAELTLRSSARTIYTVDERKLPTGRRPVSGSDDLRGGRRVGGLSLDDCFTDQATYDGRHTITLTSPEGSSVEVWTDESFSHVVLLTTDRFVADDGEPTLAVAIEPQTAAVDSFNNGIGLKWLAPGESFDCAWGVVPRL